MFACFYEQMYNTYFWYNKDLFMIHQNITPVGFEVHITDHLHIKSFKTLVKINCYSAMYHLKSSLQFHTRHRIETRSYEA